MGQGNETMPAFRPTIARLIRRAADSAEISNGVAAASMGAIEVATNQGQMVVTTTPRFRSAIRRPSMYRLTAPLLAQ